MKQKQDEEEGKGDENDQVAERHGRRRKHRVKIRLVLAYQAVSAMREVAYPYPPLPVLLSRI